MGKKWLIFTDPVSKLITYIYIWQYEWPAPPQLILGDPKTVLPIEAEDRRRHTAEKHLKVDFPMS